MLAKFRTMRGGVDTLKASEWNALVKEVRRLSNLRVSGNLEVRNFSGGRIISSKPGKRQWFIGRIHNLGPAAEANYTDQRYWVKEQTITNNDNDDTTDLIWGDYGSDDALWVTATNLAEVISESHDFPDNNNYPVIVYRSSDATGIARYVFNSLAIVVD